MEMSNTEKEMLETIDVVKNFDFEKVKEFADRLKIGSKRLILTGMGSSVIFPAKNAKEVAFKKSIKNKIEAGFASDFLKYEPNCFDDSIVFLCSNSGKTKEVILLLEKLEKNKKAKIIGITATKDSILHQKARDTFILACDKEHGVAATKSVAEQALFYDFLLRHLNDEDIENYANDLHSLEVAIRQILETKIDGKIIEKLANSSTIYFVGSENGVAEELSLKAIEAIRKKTNFYENTEIIHGPQEVISEEDAIVVVKPSELSAFMEDFRKAGCSIFCISEKDEIYTTIKVQTVKGFENYCYLAAGWNLLRQVGHKLKVDIDHPKKATKVGNPFKG